METYLEGKICSSIGILVGLGLIFGLAIPNFYHAVQILSDSTLPPETITSMHDEYNSQGRGSLIAGFFVLIISLFYAYGYFYAEPANDRSKKAKKDEEDREYNERRRLEDERKLKENSPEMKEQREREAQAAFEHRKQELERTLRHARNHAARELELKELRMKIRDTDPESQSVHSAPPIQEDPLAAVYLTTQEIDQIARQAFTRISILPSSKQQQAWTEWQNDITEKYDLLIRNEIARCAYRLRGWGADRG